ncbi:hypothetical protein MMC30_005415 [Trapelia coarctata]|nr:hypothetical protein [Trapelia coarctata]
MALGKFLYPPNDILGDAQPQAFYSLADSIHVAWESYLTNAVDRRLLLAYYLLDLSRPWQYVAAYSQPLIMSGSITLELDLGLGGPYLGKYTCILAPRRILGQLHQCNLRSQRGRYRFKAHHMESLTDLYFGFGTYLNGLVSYINSLVQYYEHFHSTTHNIRGLEHDSAFRTFGNSYCGGNCWYFCGGLGLRHRGIGRSVFPVPQKVPQGQQENREPPGWTLTE